MSRVSSHNAQGSHKRDLNHGNSICLVFDIILVGTASHLEQANFLKVGFEALTSCT